MCVEVEQFEAVEQELSKVIDTSPLYCSSTTAVWGEKFTVGKQADDLGAN